MARKNRKRNRNRKSNKPIVKAPAASIEEQPSAEMTVETAMKVFAASAVTNLEVEATNEPASTEPEIASTQAMEPSLSLDSEPEPTVTETKPAKKKRRRRRSRGRNKTTESLAETETQPTAEDISSSIDSQIDALVNAVDQTIDEATTADNNTFIDTSSDEFGAIPEAESSLPTAQEDACKTSLTANDDLHAAEEQATTDDEKSIAETFVAETTIDETPISETFLDASTEQTSTDIDAPAEPEPTREIPPSIPSHQIAELIATNTSVLQQVIEHLAQNQAVDHVTADPPIESSSRCDADLLVEMQTLSDQVVDLSRELDESQEQLADVQQQLERASRKNDQLTDELESVQTESLVQNSAPAPIGQNPESLASEPLTWEHRKELMLQQMENDSFDAESFVQSIQSQPAVHHVDDIADLEPAQYVSQLNNELSRISDELRQRNAEVRDLQNRLESGDDANRTGIENGTAAIEDLIDVDALIRDERERLQNQQREWEDRFRETEIAASLERAKLSRERRELAKQNAELEEQLIHFRRESEVDRKAGTKGSRRWLSILGLSDD